MELNDNKAGMQGLDKQKINAIIRKATEGSKYHEHQKKKEERLQERIQAQKELIATFSPNQIAEAESKMDALCAALDESRDLSRSIIHVDMDAYYAAVEMRDDPTLRHKPMAVGSNSMLSTSNYAARKFGVRAAMPGFIAKKLCPQLVIVPCNFDKYTRISNQIREIMARFDPNYAPMSLDEAYLDVTDCLQQRPQSVKHERTRFSGDCVCRLPYVSKTDLDTSTTKNEFPNPDDSDRSTCKTDQRETSVECDKCGNVRTELRDWVEFGTGVEEVARELRFLIENRTGLTASAGIASNTFLAKVCSDMNKPNGQFFLKPNRDVIMQFVRNLSIRKVPGIGQVSESLLKAASVTTCGELFEKRGILSLIHSEISARFFIRRAMGIGSTSVSRGEYNSTVERVFMKRDIAGDILQTMKMKNVYHANKDTFLGDHERKSISVERTFDNVKYERQELIDILNKLCLNLADDIAEKDLKTKTERFDVRTRASSVSAATLCTFDDIYSVAREILINEMDTAENGQLRLRLMGVRLSGFGDDSKAHGDITKFLVDGSSPRKHSPRKSPRKRQASSTTSVNPAKRKLTESGQSANSSKSVDQSAKTLSSFGQSATQESLKTLGQSATTSRISDQSASTSKQSDQSAVSVKILHQSADFTCSTKMSSSNQSESSSKTFDQSADKMCDSSQPVPSNDFVCPICLHRINKAITEDQRAKHVDSCLNRQEIANILAQEKCDTVAERKNSDKRTKKVQKKSKTAIGKKTVELDQFFMKN